MRKIFMRLGLALCIMLGTISSALAHSHNGWSQTNTPIVETGQQVYVELLFGNHSNDHTSYRIDQNWGMEDSQVKVITPSGQTMDITDQFFYMGELAEVDEERIGVNNYYAGSFQTKEQGAYIIAAEGNFTYGYEEEPTLRSAKSFVASSKVPNLKKAKKIKGFDKQVTPERAELIPLFNPAAVTPGTEVSAQLLLKGEPISGVEVAVIRRSDSSDIRMQTDQEGKITWQTGEADYYLVRAEIKAEDHQQDDQDYEATMTFFVQK
ncbi:putative GH25 family protein [Caldalkalibacillus uzonensis]|uniref:GH25 family protein n=1 Tax=Caldalkalibacillus uzonensis TaxID=353224 RepID=A0ABU0CY44_9BACI|nr:DUF4198 domain-containing protein [Caldalkalibacillus uzonensis]MDQ0341065.1 putative GH25 family protein [Caldalkalibacillus uzonensis]